MTTNSDIKLINDFLELPEIYEMFQFFLESKDIDGSEAELILKTLNHEDE